MNEKVHWADVVAGELAKRSDEHVVACGITPSGPIHIGNMREVLTADLVYRALVDAGTKARLIYIADTFDPLRRRYPFLDESYDEHIGKPLSRIPCPCGGHTSYAEHFLEPFLSSLDRLDVHPEVLRAHELYERGVYDDAIIRALQRRDEIAHILEEVSARRLSSEWSPFSVLCPVCGRLNSTRVLGYEGGRVLFACECGEQGEVDIRGGGKLTWRVDWAARWSIFKITCEPFGKDHAAAGGSYDTGVRISREIYGYEPPYPVVYEWIQLRGTPMSSSKGVAVTIEDMLDVVPPEVLRYLIARIRPEKHIEFDPSRSLLQLIDEFEALDTNSRVYQLSRTRHGMSVSIPFRHMVTVVQTAQSERQVLDVLKRSGYAVEDEHEVLALAHNARVWVQRYAPEEFRFTLAPTLPEAAHSLSEEQKRALALLAESMKGPMSAEEIHAEVYAVAERVGIKASKVFQAIYMAFLGRRSGPRAGWFLFSLDRNFVLTRLREASA
ncbi:MAG TPA: lysine--tRNA ligase [Methermicoccus shengliensis]|uniref:Lysine--tRNA ligase n=1 Tax=Methermicoccus shengliensis TaxID=660064 RepID=A0A832VXF8_9EURY|nr:lysine--tRNA ligase [Methermicoccus shengliensis]KUK05204.1 MAG: Lysine--tRNA ligase [Euryarchaeota archaeon 55_53]KUK30823.1 MAG: Lysine--tRNA ligase [Methanosarcinales archeaon 56_1174]MDI3487364.1 lysyl-tRNA synthetase, class [Methanosarcinales archaeon]MDN5294562.1 lysyl-tRNA synthetase, class [Methanosarcinales archaeon]HIH69708.1 lysine--tRNA ligase [Methermicoccus shengliensis]